MRTFFTLMLLLLPETFSCYGQKATDEHIIEIYKIKSSDQRIQYHLLVTSTQLEQTGLPVLYILDPDYHYLQFLKSYDSLVQKGLAPHANIVGIGYGQNFLQREYGVLNDLTPTKMDPKEYNEDVAVIPKDSTFLYTGGSEKFISFIKKEVFPFVEKKLHPGKEKVVYGNGYAGLFLCYLLSKDASLFDNYIISNPFLWWNQNYVPRTANMTVLNGTRIFFSLGERQERKVVSSSRDFLERTKSNVINSVFFPTLDGYLSIPKGFRDGLTFIFKEN